MEVKREPIRKISLGDQIAGQLMAEIRLKRIITPDVFLNNQKYIQCVTGIIILLAALISIHGYYIGHKPGKRISLTFGIIVQRNNYTLVRVGSRSECLDRACYRPFFNGIGRHI